ncbi:glucosamine-6-phosphate isomerase [Pelomyxa schiedti]|nr:glucosamine-6-phosphate isomerase [Pelomyxa schiedti]
MRIVIRDTAGEVSEWVAAYIKRRILDYEPTPQRPFVLGLPTGSSPIATYKKLIEYYQKGELSFKNVVTFNMDEYVGLPETHPQSYHYFMHETFFKHIDIPTENINILDGNATDLLATCIAYEEKIKALGGIELFLGGVGSDGHIAFNEPGSSLTSRTRLKTLSYETVLANARFFEGNTSLVPRRALTVGVGTIMDANEVVVIITGRSKAMALNKCVEEGVNHMWTVSILQMHQRTIVACDDDATDELRVKTVKYFKGLQRVYNDLLENSTRELASWNPPPSTGTPPPTIPTTPTTPTTSRL